MKSKGDGIYAFCLALIKKNYEKGPFSLRTAAQLPTWATGPENATLSGFSPNNKHKWACIIYNWGIIHYLTSKEDN